MNELFVISEVFPGRLNALVKNLMKQMGISDPNEAVRRINSGEWVVSEPTRRWRKQNGVIYFSVTSDGTTGPQWIERLEKKGFQIVDRAKSVLRSSDFKPTNGVTTEIAVLKGTLFADNERITKKIRAEADKRKFENPNAEVACLIRENFSDEEIETMDLRWIIVMHEPIKDSGGGPGLLGAYRGGDGRWLSAYCGRLDFGWDRGDSGFAFAVAQVGT